MPTKKALTLFTLSLLAYLMTPWALADDKPPAFEISIKAKNLRYPWAIAWLNSEQLFITERTVGGWIVNTQTGKKQRVQGWPKDINSDGQGGLLDAIADPNFSQNKKLYFSFTHQNSDAEYTTRVASAVLSEQNELSNWQVLFTALPYSKKTHHYGSRLGFKGQHLLISVGDRGKRHRAQDLADFAGKIHRINTDGSPVQDNPFIGQTTAEGKPIPASIYSYGHRNPQGMYIDQQGNIWINEHGPRGGDELNKVHKGQNYGWPIITYGREYWGPSIGEGTHKEGMQQPEYYYVPSIGPSGLVRYESGLIKEWQGDFLMGALKKRHLNRLTPSTDTAATKDNQAYAEHRYLTSMKLRLRDIEVDQQGAIYIISDGYNGKLIKLTPE